MAGLIDSFPPGLDQQTMAALQAYVNQYAPTDEDKKRALSQALMAGGFGLMGARKGSEWAAAGQAGQNALGTYNSELTRVNQQKLGSVAAASQAMNLQDKLRQFQSADQARRIATQYAVDNGAPGQAQAAPLQQPAGPLPAATPQQGFAAAAPFAAPPLADIAQVAATNSAPAQSQQPTGTPAGVPGKNQTYAYYSGLAQKYYAAGLTDQATAAQAMAEKYRPELKETKTLTQNGQRITVNIYKDGTQEVVPFGPDLEKLHFQDTGGGYQGLDQFTGQPVAGASGTKTMTPGEKASNAVAWGNLAESKRKTNLQYDLDAQGLPQGNTDEYAKMIANYDTPFPQTIMYRRPEMGAQLIAKVQAANPTYDAKNYPVAQQTMTAFAKGKQGDTVRSIGVGLQHMDVLGKAIDALGNNDFPLFNRVANFAAQQTGSAAPTNFDGVKQIVSNEITKAIIGAGGGVGDRDKAQEVLSRAGSPAQLKGVLDEYRNLFVGQLNGLEQQYKAGSQRDDFNKFLSPEVQDLRASKSARAAGLPIYKDAKGNRAYKNPDGSFTPIQ